MRIIYKINIKNNKISSMIKVYSKSLLQLKIKNFNKNNKKLKPIYKKTKQFLINNNSINLNKFKNNIKLSNNLKVKSKCKNNKNTLIISKKIKNNDFHREIIFKLKI